MGVWTFITNHGAVLAIIGQREKVTAREISIELDITERSVLRIIKDLEDAGYVTRIREGRTNRYEINRNMPLRHIIQRDVAVGELLKILESR